MEKCGTPKGCNGLIGDTIRYSSILDGIWFASRFPFLGQGFLMFPLGSVGCLGGQPSQTAKTWNFVSCCFIFKRKYHLLKWWTFKSSCVGLLTSCVRQYYRHVEALTSPCPSHALLGPTKPDRFCSTGPLDSYYRNNWQMLSFFIIVIRAQGISRMFPYVYWRSKLPPAVEVQSVASGPRRIEVHVHLFWLHEAASCMIYQWMIMDATRSGTTSVFNHLQHSSQGPTSIAVKTGIFDAIRKRPVPRHLGLVTWSSKWFQQRILPGNHHISHISWLIYCIFWILFWTLNVVVFDLLLIFLFTWFGGVWCGAQNHLSFLQMPKTNRISWAIVLAHHLIFQTNMHFQDLKTISKGGQ